MVSVLTSIHRHPKWPHMNSVSNTVDDLSWSQLPNLPSNDKHQSQKCSSHHAQHGKREKKSEIIFNKWSTISIEPTSWKIFHKSVLTFLQLVLHHHQEGDTDHEEVEAETDFTELTHSSSTHLTHHVLIRLLPADWWCIPEDDQTTDEENQRHLQEHQERTPNLFSFTHTQTSWTDY